jgi:hypothetical protein
MFSRQVPRATAPPGPKPLLAQRESQLPNVLQLSSKSIECRHRRIPPYQTSGSLVCWMRHNPSGRDICGSAGAAYRRSFECSPPGIHPIEGLSPTAPAVPYDIHPSRLRLDSRQGITRTSSSPVRFGSCAANVIHIVPVTPVSFHVRKTFMRYPGVRSIHSESTLVV